MGIKQDRERTEDGSTISFLGAHFSIAGGYSEALYSAQSYGCTALQIFTKNANSWREKLPSHKEIDGFDKARRETGITQIAAHTSYLINLASPQERNQIKSCEALKQEIIRSDMLDIPYVVLHPGSHMGRGRTFGLQKITEGINKILSDTSGRKPRLLLETTAGQGTSLGHRFEQLKMIMTGIESKERTGICLDTCHIFAAGYDIRTFETYRETMNTFDAVIGMNCLYLIHANDSKRDLGKRVDRHEHIGEGFIGKSAFEYLMKDSRLYRVPKIIETPKNGKEKDFDQQNLDRLRAFIS